MKIIKIILKNLLLFLLSGIIGIVAFFIYGIKVWLPSYASKIGLGAIALLPVVLIFSVIIGFFFGGIVGILIYHLYILIKKNLKKK